MPQLLRFLLEGQAHKTPSQKSQRGLHHQDPQNYSKQITVINGLIRIQWICSQGSVQREQREASIFQSFPKGRLFAYFKSCHLRVKLYLNTHLGAYCGCPQRLGRPQDTIPMFSLWPILGHWYFPGRSLNTCLTAQLLQLSP